MLPVFAGIPARQDNALRISLSPIGLTLTLLGTLTSSAWLACSATVSAPASGGAAGAPAVPTLSDAGMIGGALPVASALAGAANTEAGAGAGAAVGGSFAAGAPASGGASGALPLGTSGAGSAGADHAGGGSGGSGSGGVPAASCNLSTPVSFQKDIQGFLAKSCGKTVAGGCHVTDSSKTSLGYDHAYDWITAFAHTSSCGKTPPYAKRFEVVLALLSGPNPPSCPNARQMPPEGMGESLTDCQLAALQAWLAEPLVSQQHVPESDDTQALYPAGPYPMPPFN